MPAVIQRTGAALLIAISMGGSIAPNGHAMAAASVPAIAFTRNFNVYLTGPSGTDRTAVTTRGTGYQGVWYPWYSWSPDGKYMLLLRWQEVSAKGTLFLLNAHGAVIRALASPPVPTDFWPSWATDSDQIAFVAGQRVDRAYGGFRNVVERMDIRGRKHPLFTYRSHEGCGGGTSDPAGQLYWQEVGFGGDAPMMSWSVTQHVAAYTSSCAGGVNIIDLRNGHSQAHRRWIEPALSPRGTLAVVAPVSGRAAALQDAVLLVNPRSGNVIRTVAGGELPTWSRDGKALYFVHRTVVRTLSARDPHGGPVSLQVFRGSVLQTGADGSHISLLFSADAYAFGPLSVLNGGRSLIFSRIENDWNLWRHRSSSGVLPIGTGYTSPYFPHVAVMRWIRGGKLRPIERTAGRPVVQPQG